MPLGVRTAVSLWRCWTGFCPTTANHLFMIEFSHRGVGLATGLMLRSESSIPAAAFAAGRLFHQAHRVAHV